MKNKSHLTAITRTKPSAPLRALLDMGLVRGRVLDYGSGKGMDVRHLVDNGFDAHAYDSYYKSTMPEGKFDTITCTFVLNVLPRECERDEVLTAIMQRLVEGGIAYITVRGDKANLKGWTKRGTWQGHVELDLPMVAKTSSYAIYKLTNPE